jgi:hypothetical protein
MFDAEIPHQTASRETLAVSFERKKKILKN